jgi:GT2 family glycosyltransferase
MATLTLAICARNAQHIIGECLASIRAQTAAPDEVIVAVDNLSDPTAEVARSYGARVIASNATGLYEARNAVLAVCTTDYLAFTDADCTLAPEWVEAVKHVLDSRPEVAAGTGRHPPVGPRNFAAWLHHMWFIVETESTGETQGIIGGNSYFRTRALREAGGWLKLPRHSAAEDVYIAKALTEAGRHIWFEERAAVYHRYETRFSGLMRKSVMMGKDIVVMMRAAGFRDGLWWYTLAIPALAAMLVAGLVLLPLKPALGAAVAALPLLATLSFLVVRFRSLSMALPRWAARWILIWPYSWGILKGLVTAIPREAYRRPASGIGSGVWGLGSGGTGSDRSDPSDGAFPETRDPRPETRLKICLVCSHGGHLTEILQLLPAFDGHDVFYFCYDADTTRRLPRAYLIPNIGLNPLKFLHGLLRAAHAFRRERPDVVVSTGAEIAVAPFLIAKLCRTPCVYIECGAQVTRPSGTGRIVYWIADRFYVQWPELLEAYGPRARFEGSLVDEAPGDHPM